MMEEATKQLHDSLSPRQKEIVELVCKGLTNKEVANQLHIAEKTVKFHLTGIFLRLEVRNRTSLAAKIRGD